MRCRADGSVYSARIVTSRLAPLWFLSAAGRGRSIVTRSCGLFRSMITIDNGRVARKRMLLDDTSDTMSAGGWYCTTASEKRGGSDAEIREDGTNPVSS
jgi:hypothetical protein